MFFLVIVWFGCFVYWSLRFGRSVLQSLLKSQREYFSCEWLGYDLPKVIYKTNIIVSFHRKTTSRLPHWVVVDLYASVTNGSIRRIEAKNGVAAWITKSQLPLCQAMQPISVLEQQVATPDEPVGPAPLFVWGGSSSTVTTLESQQRYRHKKPASPRNGWEAWSRTPVQFTAPLVVAHVLRSRAAPGDLAALRPTVEGCERVSRRWLPRDPRGTTMKRFNRQHGFSLIPIRCWTAQRFAHQTFFANRSPHLFKTDAPKATQSLPNGTLMFFNSCQRSHIGPNFAEEIQIPSTVPHAPVLMSEWRVSRTTTILKAQNAWKWPQTTFTNNHVFSNERNCNYEHLSCESLSRTCHSRLAWCKYLLTHVPSDQAAQNKTSVCQVPLSLSLPNSSYQISNCLECDAAITTFVRMIRAKRPEGVFCEAFPVRNVRLRICGGLALKLRNAMSVAVVADQSWAKHWHIGNLNWICEVSMMYSS